MSSRLCQRSPQTHQSGTQYPNQPVPVIVSRDIHIVFAKHSVTHGKWPGEHAATSLLWAVGTDGVLKHCGLKIDGDLWHLGTDGKKDGFNFVRRDDWHDVKDSYDLIAYCGQTQLDNITIQSLARLVIRAMPRYHFFYRNCQEFVLNLLKRLLPGTDGALADLDFVADTSRSIADLIDRILNSREYVGRLPKSAAESASDFLEKLQRFAERLLCGFLGFLGGLGGRIDWQSVLHHIKDFCYNMRHDMLTWAATWAKDVWIAFANAMTPIIRAIPGVVTSASTLLVRVPGLQVALLGLVAVGGLWLARDGYDRVLVLGSTILTLGGLDRLWRWWYGSTSQLNGNGNEAIELPHIDPPEVIAHRRRHARQVPLQ